jgi:hypothetical protein
LFFVDFRLYCAAAETPRRAFAGHSHFDPFEKKKWRANDLAGSDDPVDRFVA